MTADTGPAVDAWERWYDEVRPTMPNVGKRGFLAGYAAASADYDALALAAQNTAADAERYFLAWTSARRRAALAPSHTEAVRAALDEARKIVAAARPGLSGQPKDCRNTCWDDLCTCSGDRPVLAWSLDMDALCEALADTATTTGADT